VPRESRSPSFLLVSVLSACSVVALAASALVAAAAAAAAAADDDDDDDASFEGVRAGSPLCECGPQIVLNDPRDSLSEILLYLIVQVCVAGVR